MKLKNREVRFEVTNHCNAHCVFCPRETHTRTQGVMDLDLYKRWIDEIYDGDYGVNFISLQNYGEPYIDPHLFARARYAKDRGFYTSTVSTGSLLHKKIDGRGNIEQTLECIDKLRLSYYSLTKEIYEKLQKRLNFETTTKNIHDLIDMKEKKGGITKIEMYFLLMPENEHEMEAWIKKYEPLVDGISVWKPHNWGDGKKYREVGKDQKVTCGRPFSGPLQIQWNGEIVPCCFDYNNAIVLGDVSTDTIENQTANEKHRAFREAHEKEEFHKYPFCDGCEQLTKKEDVLIYTNIKESKVGCVNTSYDKL